MAQTLSHPNVFSIPIGDRRVIYAPLNGVLAAVNRRAEEEIRRGLLAGEAVSATTRLIIEKLLSGEMEIPDQRSGAPDPVFLGIIPTRGCNLACSYCDFAASKADSPVMLLETAREAIEAYFQLQQSNGRKLAQIQFFGGEPFAAAQVVHFTVGYAAYLAEEMGMETFFEATTNGVFPREQAEWIGGHFDSVVLSLDGPKEIQDRQRPAVNGKSTWESVVRTARVLSESASDLVLRACITNETVSEMEAMAAWFSREFLPGQVCFETLSPSDLSRQAGLEPPDPWEFALHFRAASSILEQAGIETVLSTAEMDSCRTHFCPVGKDALIVSPDGTIDACYQLPESWRRNGLDMNLGRLKDGQMELSDQALKRLRDMQVDRRPLCRDCFCRYHCAGGCHITHDTSGRPGEYDRECVQTRLVSLLQLLGRLDRHKRLDRHERLVRHERLDRHGRLDQPALVEAFLGDRAAMQAAVYQPNDRIQRSVM